MGSVRGAAGCFLVEGKEEEEEGAGTECLLRTTFV